LRTCLDCLPDPVQVRPLEQAEVVVGNPVYLNVALFVAGEDEIGEDVLEPVGWIGGPSGQMMLAAEHKPDAVNLLKRF